MTDKEKNARATSIAIESEIARASGVLELVCYALVSLIQDRENNGVAAKLCAMETILEDQRNRLDYVLETGATCDQVGSFATSI